MLTPPARPRLLILDDEERIRLLLADYLDDLDEFDVRASGSAETALQSLHSVPADICIVDMRLPGMSGDAFMRAARNAGLCRAFLLHTGSAETGLTDELARLGLTEHDLFFKPADMGRIVRRIRELLCELLREPICEPSRKPLREEP